jgi:uncharacterized membrane protein YdjX (TVP38/TMEM64 family)
MQLILSLGLIGAAITMFCVSRMLGRSKNDTV